MSFKNEFLINIANAVARANGHYRCTEIVLVPGLPFPATMSGFVNGNHKGRRKRIIVNVQEEIFRDYENRKKLFDGAVRATVFLNDKILYKEGDFYENY